MGRTAPAFGTGYPTRSKYPFPLYMGSPAPGRDVGDGKVNWFAYGGSGFVLSRPKHRVTAAVIFHHLHILFAERLSNKLSISTNLPPLYMGSPAPGRDVGDGKVNWFAYGGSGFVLSRAAVAQSHRSSHLSPSAYTVR
jgi:hypothetical protein